MNIRKATINIDGGLFIAAMYLMIAFATLVRSTVSG
jgi:hypothetical protein